jgi:hypothetical protein
MQGPDIDAQDQSPPFTHIRLATHGRSIQLGQLGHSTTLSAVATRTGGTVTLLAILGATSQMLSQIFFVVFAHAHLPQILRFVCRPLRCKSPYSQSSDGSMDHFAGLDVSVKETRVLS